MSIVFGTSLKKSQKPTMAYSSRGITDLTQTQMGSLNIFAKAQFEQLAYAGYKANIEAFLYATAVGKKVQTQSRNFPLEVYNTEIPIPNPSIAFKLASTRPSERFQKTFDAAITASNGTKTVSGKTQIYTVPNVPTPAIEKFEKVAAENTVFVENHCTPTAAKVAVKIKGYIDLFLMTHLYEATKEEGFPSGDGRLQVWVTDEKDPASDLVKELENTAHPNKKMKMSDGDDHEGWLPMEYNVHRVTRDLGASVLIAKPSGEKSCKINYGSPSEVPNKPGLLFPYFHGMLSPDAPDFRSLVHELFFRLIPLDNSGSVESSWKEIRTSLMSLAATPEGLQLHHLLKGCSLALSAQARLFAIFADGNYKGFCLLGECYSVHVGNVTWMPKSAVDLRAELAKVQTKAASARELADALSHVILTTGDAPMITDEDASDPFEVADVLSMIDLGESDEGRITAVQEALKKMAFRNEYKTYSPSTVGGALDDLLLHQRGETTWKKLPFFIPIKDWNGISDPIYKILARFGSTSFSFVATAKGTWISIPDKLTTDATIGVFAESEETSNKVYFYDKPIERAVRDWREMLRRGAIRYDTGERAGAIKASSFSGPSRMPIARALIAFKLANVLGNEADYVAPGAGPKKEVKTSVSFDDEFDFVVL